MLNFVICDDNLNILDRLEKMLDTILEKLRKLDDEDLVKELSKLSKEDRWYLCPYVIDELAYDDGRKVAEPFIVE